MWIFIQFIQCECVYYFIIANAFISMWLLHFLSTRVQSNSADSNKIGKIAYLPALAVASTQDKQVPTRCELRMCLRVEHLPPLCQTQGAVPSGCSWCFVQTEQITAPWLVIFPFDGNLRYLHLCCRVLIRSRKTLSFVHQHVKKKNHHHFKLKYNWLW